MYSKKDFAETLDQLLDERDWSGRELARQTERLKDREGSISFATVSALLRKAVLPGPRAMRVIAKAMNVDPMTFAEYRLESKRQALDWRHVGLRKALKELGE